MGKNRLPILGCVVLIAVVLIGSYGYLSLNNLNNVLVKENGELKLQCDELNTRYTQLSISYDTMERQYEGLQTRYAELDMEHASLELEYDALEGRCDFWRTKYDKLQNEQAQIGEGNKFDFYYASLAKQRFGVDRSKECLDLTKKKCDENMDKTDNPWSKMWLNSHRESLGCYNGEQPPPSKCRFRRLAIRLFGPKLGWKIPNPLSS